MLDLSALEQWIEARLERDGTPALGIAITDRNETRYVGHFGYADLAARIPAGPEHVFENGSIGKSFTAILLLRLHEQGLVDLHAPVRRYLPWFDAGDSANPITLHHLLTHTSGIIEGTDVAADGRFEVWALRDTALLGLPGAHFSYSDVGYKVLGYVIEEILGVSYSAAVTKYVLEPLDMNDSFSPITDYERNRVVTGYRYAFRDRPWRKAHGLVPATWIETGTADGSIAVTTGDMARYTRAILNRGAGLISDASFALMIGDLAPREKDEPDSTYGYGLMTFALDGHHCYGHGGDMVGYYASMVCDPGAGLGVCTLSNGPGYEDEIAEAALAFARSQLSAGDPYELPQVTPLEEIAEAAELAGTYRDELETWELIADGTSLVLDTGTERAPIERYRDSRYLIVAPGLDAFHLTFRRDDDGDVTALYHGPRMLVLKGTPLPEVQPIPEAWTAYPGIYQNYNPWHARFEVFLRRGALVVDFGYGRGVPLIELEPGLFQAGDGASAERMRFDAIASGQALRATLNGEGYYRTLESSLPSTRN